MSYTSAIRLAQVEAERFELSSRTLQEWRVPVSPHAPMFLLHDQEPIARFELATCRLQGGRTSSCASPAEPMSGLEPDFVLYESTVSPPRPHRHRSHRTVMIRLPRSYQERALPIELLRLALPASFDLALSARQADVLPSYSESWWVHVESNHVLLGYSQECSTTPYTHVWAAIFDRAEPPPKTARSGAPDLHGHYTLPKRACCC